MDDCISNLVVTENYVVQPVESIPISMVDYENVGLQLVHAGSPIQTGPVIRLASVSPPTRTNELHPLEAEIQRDLELKQKHFSRQAKPSTMIPECQLESIGKKSSHFIQMIDKQMNGQNDTLVAGDDVQLHHIFGQERNGVLKNGTMTKSDQVNIPQIFHSNRQMIVQGKQFIFVPENHSVLINDWKGNKNYSQEIIKDVHKCSDQNDAAESVEIPLTVQNYNHSNNNNNNIDNNSNNHNKNSIPHENYQNCSNKSEKSGKSKEESDTENEGDEIEPVCDYEPDPESTTSAETEDSGKPNKCYMCFKSFRQKKNMYAHIRKIHSTQPKIEGGILCPLCKMHALRQEHLRNHFETLHDVRIEKEEKLFNTMEDFFSWKEFVERETLSLYVSKSSAKLLANNQQKTYYKCHRSGNYITVKKEDRKKKLKVQGSNKIGATCPAAMEVTENVHGVNVIFWKTHVGHDNDLAHLVLTKEDKARIAECLNSGVPWDSVLEKIKKEAEKSSNPPSRLTMVSKQDLRNIKKLHDLKNFPDPFPMYSTKKKVCHGRKPMKERMLRRASQSLVVEKADLLLNLLETTEIVAEFRPKVCLMIDNLISTVKRRAVKSIHKREKSHKKRRRKQNEVQIWRKSVNSEEKSFDENGEETGEGSGKVAEEGFADEEDIAREMTGNVAASNSGMRKRGRPAKKANSESSHKMRKSINLNNKC